MVSLPNKAVCFMLSLAPLDRATPLYLAVTIDPYDEALRDLFWRLRAHYKQRSHVRVCSEPYFLLASTLADNQEAA